MNHQVRLHEQRSREEEDSAASFLIESCRLGETIELGSGDDFVITDAKALEGLGLPANRGHVVELPSG